MMMLHHVGRVAGVVGAAVAMVGAAVITRLRLGHDWRLAWPIAVRNMYESLYSLEYTYDPRTDVLVARVRGATVVATRGCNSDPMVVRCFDANRNVVSVHVIGFSNVCAHDWAQLRPEIGNDHLFEYVMQHVVTIQDG